MLARHAEPDRMSDLRRGIELSDPGNPWRFVKEQLRAAQSPATARQALGTTRCEPERRVVCELGCPPVTRLDLLPAYAKAWAHEDMR